MKFFDYFLMFLMLLLLGGAYIGAFGWWGVLWLVLSIIGILVFVGCLIWREEVALEKLYNRGKKL